MLFVTYKGTTIILSLDFSVETFNARRLLDNICEVLKKKQKPLLTKNTISSKISFKTGEIKTFLDEQKLKVHQHYI